MSKYINIYLINKFVHNIESVISFNDVFCIFIILVALISYRRLHKDVRRNIKDIQNFISKSENIKGDLLKQLATDFSLEFSKVLSDSINRSILPGIDEALNKIVQRDISPNIKLMNDMIDNFTEEELMEGIV